jgi:hypothetical protein
MGGALAVKDLNSSLGNFGVHQDVDPHASSTLPAGAMDASRAEFSENSDMFTFLDIRLK